jgi:hypothetical protein
MSEQDIIERLDRLIAIQQIAHKDVLEAARSSIRSDKVNAAILDASTTWVPSAKMQTTVATKTKASTRTIQERIADLIAQGVLEKRGATRTTEYRASGLI